VRYSIVRQSVCSEHDFGHFLLSPDFFLGDKISCWEKLGRHSDQCVSDCFLHIKSTVNEVSKDAICYNLTDGLSKFLDGGVALNSIQSHKKTAKKNDFVISRLRSYLQEMAIVENRNKEQVFSTEFLIFRSNDQSLSTYSLFSLCMTKHVQTILKRGQYGTGHPRFYDFLLTRLPIPNSVKLIDGQISDIIKVALSTRKQAKGSYAKAESTLLSEIGLLDWISKSQLTFLNTCSATERTNRIDAEYFQPKYDQIVAAIKGYAGGWDILGNLVDIKKSIEVGSGEYLDEGIPFVRVSNLSPFEITEEKYISGGLYAQLKQHQPQQGEILFSKDATPGIAHYLREKPAKMIPSGGVLRLLPKSNLVNNDCLTLILNSLLVQEQINRDCGGSVILHWRPEQVKETLIPILPEKVQAKIQQKSAESHNLHKQSKRLLDCAKQAVEIAIEKGEKKALRWIEREAV